MSEARLRTDHVGVAYGKLTVIPDLSFAVPDGKITSLVGRNGSGKSTLLRAMGRLLRPRSGAILLDGKAIAELPTREVAQKLAILPQGPTAPEGMTVRDLVAQGRYPYRSFLGIATDEDSRVIAWALEQTGMTAFAARPLDTLSGGQRQRAWVAMALAQDTPIMLLDEPTTFLDVAYQLELMELLRELNRRHARTILMVLHDLNQAAKYSDHLVAVKDGRIHSAGDPATVLTAQMIREVFGIDAEIVPDPRTGAPMCLPHGLAPEARGGREGDIAPDAAGAPDRASVVGRPAVAPRTVP